MAIVALIIASQLASTPVQAASPPIVVTTSELPAARMASGFSAVCGSAMLIVKGIGGVGEGADLLLIVDGDVQPLYSPRLSAGLSRRGAAYRLAARCGDGGTIMVSYHRGERQNDGSVAYALGRFSAATNGTLTDMGEGESDAETYWFR